jgi:hypothetical protein
MQSFLFILGVILLPNVGEFFVMILSQDVVSPPSMYFKLLRFPFQRCTCSRCTIDLHMVIVRTKRHFQQCLGFPLRENGTVFPRAGAHLPVCISIVGRTKTPRKPQIDSMQCHIITLSELMIVIRYL